MTKPARAVLPRLSLMHGVPAEHAEAYAELRSRRHITVIGTGTGTDVERRFRQLNSQNHKRKAQAAAGKRKGKAPRVLQDDDGAAPMDGAPADQPSDSTALYMSGGWRRVWWLHANRLCAKTTCTPAAYHSDPERTRTICMQRAGSSPTCSRSRME